MATGPRAAYAAAAAAVAVACAGGGAARPTARPVAVGYTSPAALAAALERHPATVVRRLPALRVAQVVPRGDASSFARALGRERGIRYVDALSARASTDEPGLAPSPAGPAYEWQWAAARENAVPPGIQRAAAGVTIAVVDTGADVTAPDLAAKAPVTYSAVTGGTDVRDANGHGTFVASIAAGSVTNGDGIAGFGGDARLLVVQASRSGDSFTDLDEAAAIVWAVDHGAKIVNLSLGGSTTSRTERDAVDYAVAHGVLLVAAAGNDHEHGNPVEYPAALLQPVGSDGVGGRGLAVGASNAAGARASFSNTGSYLSLVAPGVDVLGAVAATSPPADYPRLALPGASGLYGEGSGTSYAAPQVAGAAALVWAGNPALSAQDVAEILKATASNHGTWNPETGWGVLDVAAAVAQAGGGTATAATVRLTGTRVARRVRLAWSGSGAAAYRLAVSEDGGPRRTLPAPSRASTSYGLAPGHVYVFTVDAVDASGATVASSAPYRASLGRVPYASTRSIRAPRPRSRSSIRS